MGHLHHHQKPGGRQTQGGFRGRCGRDHRPCQVGILFNGSVLTFDPCRWRLDCQDRIGIVTGYEIVYCSITDEMEVDKICAGRNLTQEIPRPYAEKANLTNLTPWTPYKVKMIRVIRDFSQVNSNQLCCAFSPWSSVPVLSVVMRRLAYLRKNLRACLPLRWCQ